MGGRPDPRTGRDGGKHPPHSSKGTTPKTGLLRPQGNGREGRRSAPCGPSPTFPRRPGKRRRLSVGRAKEELHGQLAAARPVTARPGPHDRERRASGHGGAEGQKTVLTSIPRTIRRVAPRRPALSGIAWTTTPRRTSGSTASPRLPESHREFGPSTTSFPLLTDEGGRASEALGVLRENRRTANRVTFLLDPEGRISRVYPRSRPRPTPTRSWKTRPPCSGNLPTDDGVRV